MPDTYPDSPPPGGWPASHDRRLAALEGSLGLKVAAGAAIGTGLPAYLRPEMLDQVRELATQYPGAAVALGALVLLAGAKIAPPDDPRWRPVWEMWARWVALTPWDRWGGMPKAIGRIVPEPPPPSKPPPAPPPPTPRDPGLYPPAGETSGSDTDPRGTSFDDPERTPRP
jgi:hypothetical protein